MARGKSKVSRIVYFTCLVALAVGLGVIVVIAYSYWEGQDKYDKIAQTAFDQQPHEVLSSGSTDNDSDLSGVNIDWDALRALNGDVVGWIYMPDTPINYPIVHAPDNDKYLYVNFNGEYGNGLQPTYGTPFLMAQNANNFSDPVNIIEAHNLANGTMFAEIPKMLVADDFNSHRRAYIFTPQGNYRLLTVSILVGGAYDSVVQTSFDSGESFSSYVQELMDRSQVSISTPVPSAGEVGKVFLLSTCTSDNSDRRVILGCVVTRFIAADSSAENAAAAN